MAKETPLVFAGLGLGVLLLTAGFNNKTVAEVLSGDTGSTSGTTGQDTFSAILANATTDIPGADIGGLLGASTGVKVIDGHPVAGWIVPVVAYARKHGWHGTVTSGVRTDSEQRAACIHVCGNPNGCEGTCAPPGQSNHRGSKYPLGAIDVTDPAGFARAISTYPGGPPIKNDLPKDVVHFSASGH
jgi:hypothetical protein